MTCILTLRLDPATQAHFDRLRERHFPPERNQIPAHLTLFHTLPDGPEIDATLADAARSRAGFAMQVTGLRSLGKGVAYTLASPELQALHHQLASSFADILTPQDRQRFMPHIVVQNKTTPASARILLAELQDAFTPFAAQAEGLDLWEYLGGPWRFLESYPFRAALEGTTL